MKYPLGEYNERGHFQTDSGTSTDEVGDLTPSWAQYGTESPYFRVRAVSQSKGRSGDQNRAHTDLDVNCRKVTGVTAGMRVVLDAGDTLEIAGVTDLSEVGTDPELELDCRRAD